MTMVDSTYTKIFEQIYKSTHLKEEDALSLVMDAKNTFLDIKSVEEDKRWDWITDRITNELRDRDVQRLGYLEGQTWKEFFNQIDFYLRRESINNIEFFRYLIERYKRALWGLEDIKDQNGISLKDYVKIICKEKGNNSLDNYFQQMEVKGQHGIGNVDVKNALAEFEVSRRNS